MLSEVCGTDEAEQQVGNVTATNVSSVRGVSWIGFTPLSGWGRREDEVRGQGIHASLSESFNTFKRGRDGKKRSSREWVLFGRSTISESNAAVDLPTVFCGRVGTG